MRGKIFLLQSSGGNDRTKRNTFDGQILIIPLPHALLDKRLMRRTHAREADQQGQSRGTVTRKLVGFDTTDLKDAKALLEELSA